MISAEITKYEHPNIGSRYILCGKCSLWKNPDGTWNARTPKGVTTHRKLSVALDKLMRSK